MKKVVANELWTRYAARFTALLAAAMLSTGLLGIVQPVQAQQTEQPKAPTIARIKPNAVELESWRQTILHTKKPKKSCFVALYPDKAWTEVMCTKPPKVPQPPAKGPRANTVGNGVDLSAQAASGFISQGEGWFDSATGVTSEAGGGTANAFTLQLNSEYMSGTSACKTIAGCQGWEQFVFSNSQCEASWAYPHLGSKSCVYIEYWLIGYGSTCPSSAWNSTGTDCWINGATATPVPPQTVTSAELETLKLTGQIAGISGAEDTVLLTIGTTVYSAPGDDYIPDLGSLWQIAEFNIFGDCCGSEAVFNSGSTLEVRTLVDSGTASAPTCSASGYTGETNNLTLVDTTTSPGKGKWPSLIFTESNSSGITPASCAGAITLGDTHITTFDGLYYDFQASGEFVLVDAPDFTVQTRQASGAPTWPDAAVNKGIATQMGNTRVEVDVEPERLLIDGKETDLADGKTAIERTGVQVRRHGSEYDITSARGDAVRATLTSNGSMSWINATVGLGKTPAAKVHGLLGNPEGDSQQLITARGQSLREPVSFTDLYQTYGESWRVAEGKSLFTTASRIVAGIPSKPFFAADLDPAAAAHALTACKAAGIVNKELLESCTLDTTVLNNEKAVKAFTIVRTPIHLIRPVALATPKVQ